MSFMEIRTSSATAIALPPFSLFQLDTFILFPARHIGEDDFIPLFEPLQNLDAIGRGAPDGDLHPRGGLAIAVKFEDADRAFLLAECRTREEQHIPHTFQIYRSIHAEIRHGTSRQFAL